MTIEDAALIQTTFALIVPKAEAVSATFYQKLFELAPGIRALFTMPPEVQRRKFIYTLELLTKLAARPDRLLPEAAELGRRHAGYKARPEHYPLVGAVLIETLREHVGESFTPQAESAWRSLYDLVARSMQGQAIAPIASPLLVGDVV